MIGFLSSPLFLELIEAKTTGCFDLLDEESKLPTPRPEHFTTEVHNRNRGHPRLDVRESLVCALIYLPLWRKVPRKSKLRASREIRDDEGFLVQHFAGGVVYSTVSKRVLTEYRDWGDLS